MPRAAGSPIGARCFSERRLGAGAIEPDAAGKALSVEQTQGQTGIRHRWRSAAAAIAERDPGPPRHCLAQPFNAPP